MGRKLARESTMKLLYQMEVMGDFDKSNLVEFYENNDFEDDERKYITDAIVKIRENLELIDKYIEDNIDTWAVNRLARVDLSILRISIYEILYREDIPKQVSINEAIEIAKKYSTEESSKFINGILGGFVRGQDLENENKEV